MLYEAQNMDDQSPDAIKHDNPPRIIGKHGGDKSAQIISAFDGLDVGEIGTIEIGLPCFKMTNVIQFCFPDRRINNEYQAIQWCNSVPRCKHG